MAEVFTVLSLQVAILFIYDDSLLKQRALSPAGNRATTIDYCLHIVARTTLNLYIWVQNTLNSTLKKR